MPTATEPFVPAEFDAAVWENVEPLWRALMDRPVESAGDLETWLLDRSELDAACSESAAMLYINMTCDTADTEAAGAYRRYIEEVAPKMKPAAFRLDRRQAELAEHQAELERADAAALVLRLNSDGRPGGETTAHV